MMNQHVLEAYLREEPPLRLHLGCGSNELYGWLNTDLTPRSPCIFGMDATKPFPLPHGQFAFVFSEHMIEHVPFESGLFILHECFRVLQPGGHIRISTPDLHFLIDLYLNPRQDYVEWATESFIPWAPYPDRTFVINNFVRDWAPVYLRRANFAVLNDAGRVYRSNSPRAEPKSNT